LILSDGKNRFKIKQGTSWWETVFLGGSMVEFVNNVSTFVLALGPVFRCHFEPDGGAWSADDARDPGGGGGNKFELLDITEE
jgi:hypothetical protein